MPKNILKENVNYGEVVYGWSFKEYEKYSRSIRWYIITGIIAVLLVGYAVISANYLFALIIVLFGIIMMLQEMNEPADLNFLIVETGIVVGTRYYSFSELDRFWIVYSPPDTEVLYFGLKNVIKHRLHIPLLDVDPIVLRDYLDQYLEEDLEQEDEPLSDRFARLLKIQ